MQITNVDHVGVTTSDLDRAKRFYGGVLGLPLRSEGEDGGAELDEVLAMAGVRLRWAEYRLSRGQILEVLQYLSPEGAPLIQRTCDPGSAHLALAVDDIEELHAHLVREGVVVRSAPVRLDDEGDWHGYRVLYALDPDGFAVEFVEVPADASDRTVAG